MLKTEIRFISELIPSDILRDALDESIEKSIPNLRYEWMDQQFPSSSYGSIDPAVLTGIVTASATVLASLITVAATIILQKMKDRSASQKEKLKVTIISSQGTKSIITSSGTITDADLEGCPLDKLEVLFDKSLE